MSKTPQTLQVVVINLSVYHILHIKIKWFGSLQAETAVTMVFSMWMGYVRGVGGRFKVEGGR
jgi:hypothetical protein